MSSPSPIDQNAVKAAETAFPASLVGLQPSFYRPLTVEEKKLLVSGAVHELNQKTLGQLAPYRASEASLLNEYIKDIQSLKTLLAMLEIRAPQVKVTEHVLLTISQHCMNGKDALLWVYTLAVLTRQNQKLISVEELSNQFLSGFPTRTAYETVWLAQRGTNHNCPEQDNILDHDSIWEALKV